MRSWKSIDTANQRLGVLLFDGFSNHCLANAVEPLRAANMLSGRDLYNWEYLTLNGQSVRSSSGLDVAPHGRLTSAKGDILFVMPSYGFLDHVTWPMTSALRSAAARYMSIAGLDTGSWLLAEAGLLNERRATIHWEELDRFSEQFPEINTCRERYVIDGDRITCSGATATFDLTLRLIGDAHGEALRLEVATLFMVPEATNFIANSAAHSPLVSKALGLMQENLEDPITIMDLAAKLSIGQKQLEAKIQLEFGTTPQAVYKRLRLNLARRLTSETTHSIAEIAVRSGYQDASAMTRAFRQEFGTTPSRLRRQI